MHMADALVTPIVGSAMLVAAAGVTAYSVKKIKKEEDIQKKIPLMGVVSAFVFAAQMVNFSIPGTGSSGHLGGGSYSCSNFRSRSRIFITCFNINSSSFILW